jgi:membrane fusion protein, copper/silver efflux system
MQPDLPRRPGSVEPMPEGAEAPPPGTRAMATVRWAIVVAMALLAATAWATWAGARSPGGRDAVQYQCPMHPSVVQPSPGSCPICGMDLVEVRGQAHPRPHDAAGDGATAAPAAKAAPVARGTPGKYWCPMHPEVTSDDPAARCEKCGGMKLVPRPAGEGERAGDVAGLVPVEIDAARVQRIGVRTATAERQRLGAELRTAGVVAANEAAIATVTARTTGWLQELLVPRAGQEVRRGQALATVYSADLVSGQQAFLAGSLPGAQRVSAGFGIDSVKWLELLGMARQDVEKVRQTGHVQLSVPVRSPIDGFVSRRAAYAGQYLQPGTELFQIVDLSTVWVMADVYEDELGRVEVGQHARLTLAAYPGETFTGRVDFVYPAVNGDSRTLQARIVLRNPGLKLRPGMYGDVVLEGAPVEGLAVPSEAVADTGERQYVFVAREGGRFEPRLVKLGIRADDRVQVLEGLAEGDRVVTTASFLVDSESRLRAAVEGFGPGTHGEHP